MTRGEPLPAMERTLYVVATPLGNLRDITLRALDVLGQVDVVAAEDTRLTGMLLKHYGISTRLLSLHEHNESRRANEILRLLAQGKSVALVCDAGTPAISDPGAKLVRAVREAGAAVVPIPGPSALVAALSAAGLDAERFAFLGFLPSTPAARRDLLNAMASQPLALIIYEAPHRVLGTVEELARVLDASRTLVVARELTKAFETITRIPLGEAAAWFAADTNRERGEFVLIIDAAGEVQATFTALPADVERWLAALLEELPPARAARVAAAVTGTPRDQVYARAVALRQRSDR